MNETVNIQLRAARKEMQEILQWLDWATEVGKRIEARLAEVEAAAAQEGGAPAQLPEEKGPMGLMDGFVAYNVSDFQAAIDRAGQAFWKRYGKPPLWVALPRGVDPASLKLWTLRLAEQPAPPGTVVVGGAK